MNSGPVVQACAGQPALLRTNVSVSIMGFAPKTIPQGAPSPAEHSIYKASARCLRVPTRTCKYQCFRFRGVNMSSSHKKVPSFQKKTWLIWLAPVVSWPRLSAQPQRWSHLTKISQVLEQFITASSPPIRVEDVLSPAWDLSLLTCRSPLSLDSSASAVSNFCMASSKENTEGLVPTYPSIINDFQCDNGQIVPIDTHCTYTNK